jgi:hypothetical protein
MAMIYLDTSDYDTYGLDPAMPASWCTAASSLIDAHCRRPTLAQMQYVERLRLPSGRNTVRLTYLPLSAMTPATSPIVAVRARYAVPRRGDGEYFGCWGEQNLFLMEVASAFGLPGMWTNLDPTTVDFCPFTGEINLLTNVLGLHFNEVEVTYTAGVAEIPNVVKSACAQIVRNLLATPALNVKSGALDRMKLQYFSDTLVDDTVQAMLAPYVAQKVN